MSLVVLYSNGCPRCKILKQKLDEKNINYILVDDVDKMIALGMNTVPVLEVDGEKMMFTDAVRWVNGQESVVYEKQ